MLRAVVLGLGLVTVMPTCADATDGAPLVFVSRSRDALDIHCVESEDIRTVAGRIRCRVEVGASSMTGPDGTTASIAPAVITIEQAAYHELPFDCPGNVNRAGFLWVATSSPGSQQTLMLDDDSTIALEPESVIETGDDDNCWHERGRWTGSGRSFDGESGTYCQTYDRLQVRLELQPSEAPC